ncbi:LPXTG-motif cell wall anchor domain-containing protein [Nocardioides sp. YR527]|uniref:LPXTG cell wall anchor domain-containing protein n=1 Tax=Nocardioides sp. YR527 TaxID=1881028 RepID=UPI00087F7FFA|nr:LPXTG cell wall anchor domain-containing protein [Nocardioides sp. YR527]SDL17748.1 LPXTG-motif cell wall anchor domain-containing protein [Nocardioides sp. YR527]
MNMHSSTKIGLAAVAVAGVATVVAAPGAQAAQDCTTTTVTSQVKVADEKTTTEVTPAVTHVEHTDALSHEESRFSKVVRGEGHEAVNEDQFRNSVYTRTYTPGTDAVTDTIEHPAETHTVEHPAETHTVEHPAEAHTVEHPAETHVVHHEAVTHEETRVKDGGYAYRQKTTGKVRYLNSPDWNGEDEHGDKGWVRFAAGDLTETVTVVDKEAWDETVVDKEAWTETVVDKEAWTETVVDKEAWTETIVDKEAWTETIVVEEATPAVFGSWQWDHFTAWTTTSGTPADEDGQDGEDNPLNLSQIGEQYQQTVIKNEAYADPDVTLYFVEDGEPTMNLADASWTADAPEGWDLVDTRTVEDSPASDVTVEDSPASSVTVVIPAVYETETNTSEKCAAVVKDASTKVDSEVPNRIDAGLAGNLPNTGGPNGALLAVGGLLAGTGGIMTFLARRRKNA